MSYILNALKKAERERLREEPQDLDQLATASWDPYQQPKKRTGVVFILSLFAIAAVMVAVYFYLHSDSPEQSVVKGESFQQESPKAGELRQPTQQPGIQESVKQRPVLENNADTKPRLPEIEITGHLFLGNGSSKNRVFMASQSYQAGDSINSDWYIVSIEEKGIVISSGSHQERILY